MNRFKFLLRWQLAFKVGLIGLGLAILKYVFGFTGFELFAANPFLPSLLGGTVVLLGFLLAGVLADFKEAEKIPTDVACALRNIYEEGVYIKASKPQFDLEKLRAGVHRIVSSFLQELGNGNRIDVTLKSLSDLNESFLEMERLNWPPPLMARLKNEQGSLRRTILRAGYIKANSFVGVAYVVAEVATGIMLAFLFLLKTDPMVEGMALIFTIAFLLIYILRLIKDMDDPFEFKEGQSEITTADVNPSQLYELKHDLEADGLNSKLT